MNIFKSKFTPGLKDATDVGLGKGNEILVQSKTTGQRRRCRVDDGPFSGDEGQMGWDVTYIDDHEQPTKWPGYPRFFASNDTIVWWEGKVE